MGWALVAQCWALEGLLPEEAEEKAQLLCWRQEEVSCESLM